MKIADIIIGERHRQDLGDIVGLADSIRTEGLLQPIGVTPQNELVFGYRRLAACRVLRLDEIDARIVNVTSIVAGEYAENEVRKDFTASERLSIMESIEQSIGNRQGQRTDTLVVNLPEVVKPGERTRDAAARLAGFGSEGTARQVATVIKRGVPELVEAMDRGDIKISAAAKAVNLPPEEQRRMAVASPKQKAKAARKARNATVETDSLLAAACEVLVPLVEAGLPVSRVELAAQLGCGVNTIQQAHQLVRGHLHGLPGQAAKPERRKRIDPPMLSLTLPSSEELGAPPPGASWAEQSAWRDKIGAKVPLHPMRIKLLQNDEVKVDQIAFVVRRLVQDGTPAADEFAECIDRMLAHVHVPEADEPGDRINYAKMAREARRMIENSIEAAIEKLQGYRAIVRNIRAVS